MKGFRKEGLFFAVVALFWFSQYIYMPFFSPYLTAIHISASVIGMIAGVYGFTQMLVRMPLSILGSLFLSRKIIIGGGLAFVFFSCILPVFAESWLIFFIARAFAGIASATWIAYSAYLLEGAGNETNRRMGYLMTASGAGTCLAQMIGMLIYEYVGMRAIFSIGAGVAAAAFALLFYIPFRKREAAGSEKGFSMKSFLAVLKNKRLWLCSILMTLAWWLISSTN
jgi:MFS family permease